MDLWQVKERDSISIYFVDLFKLLKSEVDSFDG